MTSRDRTVVLVLVAFFVVAAGWFLGLSPARKEAHGLDDRIAIAQGRLGAAEATVAAARRARAGHREDYAVVARLGKAVPADDDLPSLLVQLQGAARRSRVDFRSIGLSKGSAGSPATAPPAAQAAALGAATGGAPPTGATGPAGAAGAAAVQGIAAALPPGAAVGAAGFPTMPFDFVFTGSFFGLQDFLARLDRFTQVGGDQVRVRGRLLTVDGFALQLAGAGARVKASVHATAYLLPPPQLALGPGPAAAPSPQPAAAPAASPAVPATAAPVGAR